MFCHLGEGMSGIFWLQEAQQRYSDILFLLQNFLFSNPVSETLRSNFLLGPVITSLERNGSRAGVWLWTVWRSSGCSCPSVSPQILQKGLFSQIITAVLFWHSVISTSFKCCIAKEGHQSWWKVFIMSPWSGGWGSWERSWRKAELESYHSLQLSESMMS